MITRLLYTQITILLIFSVRNLADGKKRNYLIPYNYGGLGKNVCSKYLFFRKRCVRRDTDIKLKYPYMRGT